MTATQKITVAVVIAAGAIAFGLYEARKASSLRSEVDVLRNQQEQAVAGLSNQVQELEAERDRARTQVAALTAENAAKTKPPSEALKLRGEVSRLRQEKTELGATSGLSKVTANPESRKMMREQQKFGMSMIYKEWAKNANLTSEQTAKLNDFFGRSHHG